MSENHLRDHFCGLEEINIRNLGVIEAAHIEFKPGLNVLTGETGAGKTMVLTALALILGGKADAEKVRTGTDRLVTSGRFSISKTLQSQIAEIGAEIEADSILISRTVTRDGKSRISIGGVAATAGKISEVGNDLVEVHAQSSTNRLTKSLFIRSAVDSFGKLVPLVEAVSSFYSEYGALAARIDQLRSDQRNREQELGKLSEFLKAFSAVNPKTGELVDIESELIRLSSVDELQQALSASLNFLDNDEFSINSALVQAKRALDHVAGKDQNLDHLAQGLGDSIFQYQETLGELHRYLAALDADPSRLEYLQERKSAINSLIKKYGEGSDRAIAYSQIILRAEESSSRIVDLEGGEDRIADLENQLQAIFSDLKVHSKDLSFRRGEAALNLQVKISDELRTLSMSHASVCIEVTSGDGETIGDYNSTGLDELTLLFTSHEGAAPGLITKVASGGELSRVMLAVEVVLAGVNPVSTYVFDEIDAGVGGKAAIEVGRRLKMLAQDAQVIVVTHLAQVAVWADNHLVVRKSEGGSVSISDVVTLSEEDRSVEIARMLSGQEDSLTAREHARELLEMVKESVIS